MPGHKKSDDSAPPYQPRRVVSGTSRVITHMLWRADKFGRSARTPRRAARGGGKAESRVRRRLRRKSLSQNTFREFDAWRTRQTRPIRANSSQQHPVQHRPGPVRCRFSPGFIPPSCISYASAHDIHHCMVGDPGPYGPYRTVRTKLAAGSSWPNSARTPGGRPAPEDEYVERSFSSRLAAIIPHFVYESNFSRDIR